MAAWFRENEKVLKSDYNYRIINYIDRIIHEAVNVELICYYKQKADANSEAILALVIYPEPIPKKDSLRNVRVMPTFRFANLKSLNIFSIELEFPGRKFLLVENGDIETVKEFLKSTISLGFFVFNDDPLLGEGIRIPIVNNKILKDILDAIS